VTIKALVFDMDGTLLNTLEDLADSTNSVLAKHGYPIQDTQNYRYFVGSGARELILLALPENARQEETISTLLADYKTHYDSNWANKTHLYTGIHDALQQAANLGLKLAILTNKPQPFADLCVQHFLADIAFDIVQGQVDGVPHKPDAAMSSLVTNALQIQPNEVLYFGDSNVDMLTARNAGYHSVGVTWGFRPEQELREAGAQHMIHHPSDITQLIAILLNDTTAR